MASNNGAEIEPMEGNTGDVRATKGTGLYKDVEVGPEAIDIDRIERVYA